MTRATTQPPGEVTLDEAMVIDYLQKNPKLLLSYPDVFSAMSIPHYGGNVTSLVERQVNILRKENHQMRKKLDLLISIARENEELNQRFHRLALELLNTTQLDDLLAMIQNQVQTFFYTDYACFKFMPEVAAKEDAFKNHYLQVEDEALNKVKDWLAKRKPVCGHFDDEFDQAFFGSDASIGSSALIPLYHTTEIGFLCLGSTNKARFDPEMGTIFLEHLGELVSSRIHGLLEN